MKVLPRVHGIDKLTINTFLSGQIPKKAAQREASLLKRIGPSGVMFFSDFSTLFQMKPDERAAILADLRCIYDGSLTKEVGTSEGSGLSWQGRITTLMAATPDIERHYNTSRSLGERFLIIRWPRYGAEGAILAMERDNALTDIAMRHAVELLFAGLPPHEVTADHEQVGVVANIAELVAHARCHVYRDGGHEVSDVPYPESPGRIGLQLMQVAMGSARLDRRTAVDANDLELARRVALDCIPPARRLVLGLREKPEGVDSSMWYRAKADLQLLGLVQCAEGGIFHGLSPMAEELVRRGGLRL